MADYFCGTLTVRKADYEADANLKAFMDHETIDTSEKGIIQVTNNETRYGQFEEIEYYCVENEIAFDRWRESYNEYKSEVRMYRPGDSIDRTVYLTSDGGEPFVECYCIRSVLENTSMTESDRILQALEAILKADYPCRPIEDYRSKREKTIEA